jgi:broad specificity phosphatase PhoE
MAKGQPVRVLLIPGGATAWDHSRRLQGDCDLPMCSQGRDAVCRGMKSMQQWPLAAVYSSPDEASLETASIAAHLAGGTSATPEAAAARVREGAKPGVKVMPQEDLREMDLGLWEGLSEAELESRFPRAARLWQEDPSSIAPPEGEPFDQACTRLIGVMRRLITKAKPGTSIGVVLRPIAWGVVGSWLRGDASPELCIGHEKVPTLEWFEIGGESPAPRLPEGATPVLRFG